METIIPISENFWNIRGEFKLKGMLDIGTHASLVKCKNGRFVLLDIYTFTPEQKAEVDALTDNGKAIDAIINLHPFHTIHVAKGHEMYPDAKLYGTCRHHSRFPDLPWQPELTESEEFAKLFGDDLEFSVPKGVDFVSKNENLHFSSVLAYHPASHTIHSDDTLMYAPLPGLLSKVKKPAVEFHMTLRWTLERKAGAAEAFRQWAKSLADHWGDAQTLCAAHTGIKQSDDGNVTLGEDILAALAKVEKTLASHEKKFG